MVSLVGSGKGMSFEDRSGESEVSQHDEEHGIPDAVFMDNSAELLISSTNDIGNFNNRSSFKRVHTLWISCLMLCLSIGIFVLSAVVPFECDNHLSSVSNLSLSSGTESKISFLCFMNPVSLLLYLHSVMWGIFLICDQYIQSEHVKVRRRGYIEFYNENRVSSQLPFWIVSAWSTVLLTVSTVLHDHCIEGKPCAKTIHLTQTEYITICIGLETIALLVVLSSYSYQIWRFNGNKVPPDVLREEVMSCTLDFNPNSMGQVDEEIFHRQADLIRYFKDRNIVLQRTLLHLNNQQQQLHSSNLHT